MSTCNVLVVEKLTWTDVREKLCQKGTLADLHETIYGTACGTDAMYLKQLSSYRCLALEESLDTLKKQRANQMWVVSVSTTVVFVTDSGGDEDKIKHIARDASTTNLFLLFAFPFSLHLHHCIGKRSLTFTDFVRDIVLQDERSDEVFEFDRQDDTLLV